jgi:hypothetical protein
MPESYQDLLTRQAIDQAYVSSVGLSYTQLVDNLISNVHGADSKFTHGVHKAKEARALAFHVLGLRPVTTDTAEGG